MQEPQHFQARASNPVPPIAIVAESEPPRCREESSFSEPQFRSNIQALEKKDWWLPWVTVAGLMLVGAALIMLIVQVSLGDSWPQQFGLSKERGLLLLSLLLAGYGIHQRITTGRLRAQLADQHSRAEELHKLALFDPLTGLYNRRMAQQRLAEEMARAQRSNYSLIVLSLDLNDFKKINDRYGHMAGDLVLREFAHRIQRAIRFSDAPVRMGGDEFTILLPECNSEQVSLVLSRLSGLEVEFEGQKIPVRFSAGWAICRPGESPEQLLERTDRALYSQKKAIKQKAAENRPATSV